MKIKRISEDFSVCQVEDYSLTDLSARYVFTGRTDEENSLVCITDSVPPNTLSREDGWRGMYIDGVLDFSLVGILSAISAVLCKEGIGIFAVSTYNTDYIFVKKEAYERALSSLEKAGYEIS